VVGDGFEHGQTLGGDLKAVFAEDFDGRGGHEVGRIGTRMDCVKNWNLYACPAAGLGSGVAWGHE
jgi:hypothetical protein